MVLHVWPSMEFWNIHYPCIFYLSLRLIKMRKVYFWTSKLSVFLPFPISMSSESDVTAKQPSQEEMVEAAFNLAKGLPSILWGNTSSNDVGIVLKYLTSYIISVTLSFQRNLYIFSLLNFLWPIIWQQIGPMVTAWLSRLVLSSFFWFIFTPPMQLPSDLSYFS